MTLSKANVSNFKYFNIEPNHEILKDCVIRAITLALAIPYDDVVRLLYENGINNSCEEICITCYEKLLEDLGYKKYNANNNTIGFISLSHPNQILLIRMDGHLTCSIDGIIYDIWDCTKEVADCYWIIN